ncbi:phosphopantetheine-binding protein [Actinoplanes sp. RD1]|uniref:phosphopantetheine-binding protein n=1 Tax=Actinoplanes sp. RD1 TaxID=3064538 RepID=UPI0027404A1E|nr:phosphopantetheine-binding protein [Actinoplanes sp. RD1]
MTTSVDGTFDALVKLIREVKPGIGERPIAPADLVTDELGLDSLDLLQLSRMIHRDLGETFDLDEWGATAEPGQQSVQSILDNLAANR